MFALLAAAGIVFVVSAVAGPTGNQVAIISYHVGRFTAIGLIVARAVARREHRASWLLLATGLSMSFVGDLIWWRLDDGDVPVPSAADVAYLASYPAVCLGLLGLVAFGRVRSAAAGTWLDGLIVGGTLLTVMYHVLVVPVAESSTGAPLAELVTNVAYPAADLALAGTLVAALAMRGWHPDRRFGLLTLSVAGFLVSDSAYLIQVNNDTYVSGGLADLGWLAADVFAVGAAWLTAGRSAGRPGLAGRMTILLPGASGIAIVALTIRAHTVEDSTTVLMALGVCALIFARLVVVMRDNRRLIERHRRDAVTDALTGLANRRALMEALETEADHPRELVLFDLDGFKAYNDRFGHPAGDQLLRLTAAALRDAVAGRGEAYRLGGDEFSAILPAGAWSRGDLAGLADALTQDGPGFRVTASLGWCTIPAGEVAVDRALAEADQFLYRSKVAAHSHKGRTIDVLLAALFERDADLGAHVNAVMALAAATAERLELPEEDIAMVRHAAGLHDIGKMAIPDTVLGSPRPLTDDEWRLMRQHTLIGQRILDVSPDLVPLGELVRSSHERWDGAGYPDGLAGRAIPTGARIILVCDAFDAMTSDRPYSSQREVADAIEELERCAGTQFDPAVVAAFVKVITQGAGTGTPRAEGEPGFEFAGQE